MRSILLKAILCLVFLPTFLPVPVSLADTDIDALLRRMTLKEKIGQMTDRKSVV